MGIYPLLKDNTSWLLTADFDKENWLEESRQFLQVCEWQNMPAYLERSRSGNGGTRVDLFPTTLSGLEKQKNYFPFVAGGRYSL